MVDCGSLCRTVDVAETVLGVGSAFFLPNQFILYILYFCFAFCFLFYSDEPNKLTFYPTTNDSEWSNLFWKCQILVSIYKYRVVCMMFCQPKTSTQRERRSSCCRFVVFFVVLVGKYQEYYCWVVAILLLQGRDYPSLGS